MSGDAIASPPSWFWLLLGEARPNLATLCRALEVLPRDRLVEYACFYRDASQALSDDEGAEKLCDWVVAQGEAYWKKALARGGKLDAVARDFEKDQAEPDAKRSWSSNVEEAAYQGFESPRAVVFPIFKKRFREDLQDLID
ncbi:MAG: hypothetical protein QM756_02580 [Polyangiaceae bacterium]